MCLLCRKNIFSIKNWFSIKQHLDQGTKIELRKDNIKPDNNLY